MSPLGAWNVPDMAAARRERSVVGSMIRSGGAVLVGLAAAAVLTVGVEVFSSIFHPFPPDVDPTDYEVCKAHVARYPAWVLVLAALGWGLTTFVSVWLATRLGSRRHRAHGISVGAILLSLAVMNMSMLPYPVWFWALNLVVFPLGIFWGSHRGGRQPSSCDPKGGA